MKSFVYINKKIVILDELSLFQMVIISVHKI